MKFSQKFLVKFFKQQHIKIVFLLLNCLNNIFYIFPILADIAGRKAIARFDYEATAEDELNLEINDIVDVIGVVEPGWWQGTLKGKTGVFPDNFCELLPEEKPSTKVMTSQSLADRPPAPLPAQPGLC